MNTFPLTRINLIAMIAFLMMIFDNAIAATATFDIPNSVVHTIDSKILNRSYDLYVKLPDGYMQPKNLSRAYPSIYLNDGPYTFQVASGVTHLPMGSGKFQPSILIGISFAQGDNGMASRVRDLTPVKDKSWTKYTTGEALDYLRFIETEVIPFIEKTYRTDPSSRTLSGQSLGGSFGALALLTKPTLFANYILTSPSLWIHDEHIFKLEKHYAQSHQDLKAKVYFATGALETPDYNSLNDMVALQQRFVAQLRSRQYPNLILKDDIIEGSYHETTFPQGFTKGALWIYGNYDKSTEQPE